MGLERRLRAALLAVIIAATGALAVAISQVREDPPPRPEAERPLPEASGGRGEPAERTSFLARLIPPRAEPVRGPRTPRGLADLAARLPLERKVAQLFLVGFRGRDLLAPVYRQLRRLDLGGIVIEARNYTDPAQLAAMAGEAVVISQQESHVPPWVMTSQEGGEFSELADLPPAKAAADMASAEEAASSARESAQTLRALGITGLLGPVVDVGLEEGGALGTRAYSDSPDEVAAYAAATVRAYGAGGVLAAAKHFPGLGAASQSTDEGPATVGLSLEELANRDLIPFRAAIAAGVPAVLVGHGLYATDDFVTPASLSRNVMTGLLREELRFPGVAIVDDLAAPAVTATTSVPDAAVEAVKAGADMVFISGPRGDQEAAYLAVLNAVRKGDIPRRRVDEAVLRTLTAKGALRLIR